MSVGRWPWKAAVAIGFMSTALTTGAASAAVPSFLIGFTDTRQYQSADAATRAASLANTARARGTIVRLFIKWRDVAPMQPPDAATARQPNWSGYQWARTDAAIRSIRDAGLQPLVMVYTAPAWAEGPGRPSEAVAPAGTWRPSTNAFGDFAAAIASRYSGRFADPLALGRSLPRVRYWQGWNEPNLTTYFAPQWKRKGRGYAPVSPGLYRNLLNAFYAGVKRARSDNVVVSAGTAPYGDLNPGDPRMPPAYFVRRLFCVSDGARPKARRCPTVRFDVLAHHPYPIGPPTRRARNVDDVVIPDFEKLTVPLRLALKAGTIQPRRAKPIWATEISWDSSPPDPQGIPVLRQAQYLQSSFYILWRQGVDAVAWWNLTDAPKGRGYEYDLQSGVMYRGQTAAQDRPKPSFTAFRFPFTAYRTGAGTTVALWGLAPVAKATVVVERRSGNRWSKLAKIKATGGRVFLRQVRVPIGSVLRARYGSETSLEWTVRRRESYP